MSHAGLLALSVIIVNVLRVLTWIMISGLVALGACWCGIQLACVRPPANAPRRRRRPRPEVALQREAARGLADIERFLAEVCAQHDKEQPPTNRGDG